MFFVVVVFLILLWNVSEFNQNYEILGWPLSDPIACETHWASRERQTSGVLCVGL